MRTILFKIFRRGLMRKVCTTLLKFTLKFITRHCGALTTSVLVRVFCGLVKALVMSLRDEFLPTVMVKVVVLVDVPVAIDTIALVYLAAGGGGARI